MKKYFVILWLLLLSISPSYGASCKVGNLPNCTAKAEAGDKRAQAILGYMYYTGRGTDKDYAQAHKWFGKAAAQGYVAAQYYLGWMYNVGHGVAVNKEKSFHWLLQAADKGYAAAQHNVAVMYYTGEGVPKNEENAFYWHQQVVKHTIKTGGKNVMKSQYYLGWMYYKGQGVEYDIVKAYVWFSMALNNGLEKALEPLETLEIELSKKQVLEASRMMIKLARN